MKHHDPNVRHIHLIGICGTAMASLAGMLQAIGYVVSGSDYAAYPPMSDQLAAMGILTAYMAVLAAVALGLDAWGGP